MTDNTNTSDNKRMGKWMLYACWIVVLLALAGIFGRWEDNQLNPNRNVQGQSNDATHTVTLKQNRFGHYVSSGKLNNHDVIFMLDTGATSVAIPDALARKLELIRGHRYQVMTANGVTSAYKTNIDTLQLGTITLYDVEAAITTGMTGNEILLGMSALKQLDFQQSGKTLTLTQQRY